PEAERRAYADLHYPAYLLRVDLPRKLAHAQMIRAADAAGKQLATSVALSAFQEITEITIVAPDHPRLLSVIAGACTVAGANIVDAQIFTTADGRAIDTVFVTREFPADEDEERRAKKVGAVIEDALAGRIRLPESVATRVKARARYRPFSVKTRI